ncbi:MAG TPA: hypothetical protein ENK18_21665 [Deltaproteobacteria bacterium]|nr:hypothetical protein [Deltaproteobacteria bacterium]
MWLSVALLIACSEADPDPDPTEPVCSDTWDGWAEGFLRTWCTSCHSSGLALGQRYGAPLGLDFDTYAGTVEHADRIVAAATGEDPRMPPVGLASPSERARLAAWIACGMPGSEPAPVPGCGDDPEVIEQELTIGSSLDAEALCPEGGGSVHLRGDLLVRSDAPLRCLCEVEGSVEIVQGEEVDLSRLARIGGDLVASDTPLASLELSSLESVGGSVIFELLPQLGEVRLPWLVTVGGGVRIVHLALADRVDLSRLESVGGRLELSDIPNFRTLLGEGYALREIGGDLLLSNLDAWFGFYGFANLERIGGVLRIVDNDRISNLSGFTLLQQARGIELSGNGNLQILDGFDTLPVLAGDLRIESNPSLIREESFAALRDVVGTVSVRDNLSLSSLEGLEGLTSVGALQLSGNTALGTIEGWALAEVDGELVIDGNTALTSVWAFPELTRVGGTLKITGSDQLSTLMGLDVLGVVGGDLVLDDLASLSDLPPIPALSVIGGSVRIVGSGLSGLDGLASLSVIGGLQLSANTALVELDALHGLSHVQGDLQIVDNVALDPVEVQELIDAIDVIDGSIVTGGNGG